MDHDTARRVGRTGRPTGFVRETVVVAAMELFWRRGYLAVSAKDLSDAMGIRRSSFYNSFGDRETVFREALAHYAEAAPDAPLDRVGADDPVVPVLVEVLRALCRERAADVAGRGCLVCNGIAELVGAEPTVGPLLETALTHRIAVVERLLRQAIRQGEIGPLANEGDAARAFAAFLIGLNTASKVVRDEASLWGMCRHFLAGLGVPAAVLDAA